MREGSWRFIYDTACVEETEIRKRGGRYGES